VPNVEITANSALAIIPIQGAAAPSVHPQENRAWLSYVFPWFFKGTSTPAPVPPQASPQTNSVSSGAHVEYFVKQLDGSLTKMTTGETTQPPTGVSEDGPPGEPSKTASMGTQPGIAALRNSEVDVREGPSELTDELAAVTKLAETAAEAQFLKDHPEGIRNN